MAPSKVHTVAVVAAVVVAAVASAIIVRAVQDDDEPERVVVKITAPTNGAKVHGTRVTIRGTVEPADAVVQAFELVGKPAQFGVHHDARVAGGIFTVSVPLHGGDNQIAVAAVPPDLSRGKSTTITVARAGPGP